MTTSATEVYDKHFLNKLDNICKSIVYGCHKILSSLLYINLSSRYISYSQLDGTNSIIKYEVIILSLERIQESGSVVVQLLKLPSQV